ncbi:MAG: BlaI/MecI/CopY family transcriptional regulator [Bryobacterales bacterium]|nr:BlaI/MecI/CopY family transcriptional regulator [Bryobacterales bacterium]
MSVNKPTEFELEILNVLWQRGPSTVREVFEEIQPQRETGYTTVLKMMQLMADKGLLDREEESRAHVYRTASPKEEMQQNLVKDLIGRAFGGSALAMLQAAVSGGVASRKEIAELRKLLDAKKGRTK